MMRQRILHPGYFKDAKLLALSPLHRLLFAGLWCYADREGRLEDNPIEIKIEVLPLDNCDVGTMLDDFEHVGLIRRYAMRGRAYIVLPNFLGYQHPHPREMQSELPGPEDGGNTRKRRRAKDMPRTDLGHAKAKPVPSGSSGSSVTGSSGSSVSDPPPTSSAENPVVVEPDDSSTFDCSTASGLQALIADYRRDVGLPLEVIHGFEAWFARASAEVGSFVLVEAYRSYVHDEHFRDRGWPTAIFMSDGVWRPRARLPEPVRRRL